MAKYKKKPVIIDAVQWKATKDSFDEILEMGDVKWKPGEMGSESFYVTTLEGDMLVNNGSYVIKGVKGEFYPCDEEIFKMTYEPA